MRGKVSTCAALFLGSVFLSFGAVALGSDEHRFMPDNDLWMEDSLSATSGITKEIFDAVISAAHQVYDPVAVKNNEKLVINAKWDDSTVNANMRRSYGTVNINMFGGLARRAEVIPEGFALVLCHELGHAYGGAPFIRPADQVAAEGQADYYGASQCMRDLMQIVENSLDLSIDRGYSTKKCSAVFAQGSADNALCVRRLEGGLSLGRLLAAVSGDSTSPVYETPDTTVVSRTELSYPATVQCRLDTYHNGVLELPRPSCWFRSTPE